MHAARSSVGGLGTTCMLQYTCRWTGNNLHATRSRVVGLGTARMLQVHVLLD